VHDTNQTQSHLHTEPHDHLHVHDNNGEHQHTHTHTQTKVVLNRLSRAIGHLESVKRMVNDGRDCSEVLMQLAAVRSALNSTAKIILKDHIGHCIVEAVESNDTVTIDKLNKAVEQFLK
jgi:DNA-binding FrmR family transcriptional regulator